MDINARFPVAPFMFAIMFAIPANLALIRIFSFVRIAPLMLFPIVPIIMDTHFKVSDIIHWLPVVLHYMRRFMVRLGATYFALKRTIYIFPLMFAPLIRITAFNIAVPPMGVMISYPLAPAMLCMICSKSTYAATIAIFSIFLETMFFIRIRIFDTAAFY